MSIKISRKMSITGTPKLLCAAVCLSWLAGTSAPSRAEIVLGGRNANGTLDGSGTNKNPAPFSLSSYVGDFGGSVATPIAPHYFVTAWHVGNAGNGAFSFNNGTTTTTTYSATQVYGNPSNDLAIWQITGGGAFSLYAPLYTGTSEVGSPLVSIGNGTTRGYAINNPNGNGQLEGWNVGNGPTYHSWQTNTVDSIADNGQTGSSKVDYLAFDFNRIADPVTGTIINPDEGIFSGGDSGGPTFVLDPVTGMYELAGINDAVDSLSQTNGGPLQTLALFDAHGFWYIDNNGVYQQIDSRFPGPVPLDSYALRISSLLTPIQQTLGSEYYAPLTPLAGNQGYYSVGAVPEPGAIALLLSLGLTGANFFARRKRVRK